jgi:hypothetical protein
MSINYTEKWSLAASNATQGIEQLTEALLVGDVIALNYRVNQANHEFIDVYLYPAWHKSKRVWLKRSKLVAADASPKMDTTEHIVSFERGIEILAEHGVFDFPEPAWTVQETILLSVDDEYDREDINKFLGVEYWSDGGGYTDGQAYLIEFKDVLEEKHHCDMDSVSLGCRLDGYSYGKHSDALYALKCDWCGWGLQAYALINATAEAVREALKA